VRHKRQHTTPHGICLQECELKSPFSLILRPLVAHGGVGMADVGRESAGREHPELVELSMAVEICFCGHIRCCNVWGRRVRGQAVIFAG
jgi:hypothetical protein